MVDGAAHVAMQSGELHLIVMEMGMRRGTLMVAMVTVNGPRTLGQRPVGVMLVGSALGDEICLIVHTWTHPVVDDCINGVGLRPREKEQQPLLGIGATCNWFRGDERNCLATLAQLVSRLRSRSPRVKMSSGGSIGQ